MNHPTPNHPKPSHDPANDKHDAMQSAFEMTAEDADGAALDRLLRHTRHAVAEPARKGFGFHWGWVVGPLAAAGAAAALTLATPTNDMKVENGPGTVAVAVEPDAESIEFAISEVITEEAENDTSDATSGDEMVAALDPSANGEGGEWYPPGDDELGDDAELEAWIAAYEVVLADG